MKTLLALLVLFFVGTTVAQKCVAGEYWWEHKYKDGKCHPCNRGTFCPGDDRYYVCPNATYADHMKMRACLNCPAGGRSADSKTFCLLSNAPQDITYVNLAQGSYNFFGLIGKETHFVSEVEIPKDTKLFLAAFSSVAFRNNLKLYSSLVSGYPSPNDYESADKGQDVTVVLPVPRNTTYLPVYFTFFSETEKTSVKFAVQHLMRDRFVLATPHMLHLQVNCSLLDSWWFFEVPKAAFEGDANITVQVSGKNAHLTLSAYAHENPDKLWPNIRDFSVEANTNGWRETHKLSFTLPKVVPGQRLSVGVNSYCRYSESLISVYVSVAKKQ